MKNKKYQILTTLVLALVVVFCFSSDLVARESSDTSGVFVEIQTIYVHGRGIANAGEYPYTEGMSVADAMMLAGGLSRCGSKKVIELARGLEGERKIRRIQLSDSLQSKDIVHFKCPYF